jgi:hypothetical protein
VIGWLSAHGLVDRHFAGAGSPRADRRLFAHLRGCQRCRGRYRAHSLLEALSEDATSRARTRLGRGILVGDRRRPPLRALVLGGAIVAALVLLVGRLDRTSGEGRQLQARGGAAAVRPALTLYRLGPGGAPERTGAVIRTGDALAFSYFNPPLYARAHLMVFAYDRQGRVFWFWPAWQDPASDPMAVPIRTADVPLELGEAVRQPLRPGSLTVVGLFCDRPLTVRQVEAALGQGEAALAGLGGERWVERVEVLP